MKTVLLEGRVATSQRILYSTPKFYPEGNPKLSQDCEQEKERIRVDQYRDWVGKD